MFIYQLELNGRNNTTDLCLWDEERKRRCLATEEVEAGAAVALTAYGRPLMAAPSLKYLGGVISVSDDNWLAVIRNFWRVRQKLARLLRMLGW